MFSNNSHTPQRSRPPPGQVGSTPFRSSSTNRFQSSLVPMARASPARAQPQGKLSGFSTTSRDLFRTATPKSSRTAQFAPSLPADVTTASPGARKFASAKSVGGGMSNTASSDLFKMRIPSPDPELTGEALAREVPENHDRKGSIYADQFLAHKCPAHFDDLQRRQFFCILDLRRLKYAADEIFANKDWKLNILNFAKEYEKSRGLILLRYGLYEFKKVRPTEEVLKKWRQAHGLPDPVTDEEAPGSKAVSQTRPNGVSSTGATKRKADDDKDNTLTTSTANQNKRRNVDRDESDPTLKGPAPFKRSTRQIDGLEGTDENQANNTPQPPPSAAKSKFESILSKTQNSSPMKRNPLGMMPQTNNASPFGASQTTEEQTVSSTTKSNPFGAPSNTTSAASIFAASVSSSKPTGSATGSVLSDHKIGTKFSTTASNVFGYLSESSANSSGNENNNAEDDAEDESESEQENESQDAAPSYEPSAAASTGTSTPPASAINPFAASKVAPSSLFGNPAKPTEVSSKGGLFDRVQKGADGQPVRAAEAAKEEKVATAPLFGAPKEQGQTATKPSGGDFTFDPATTPIKFGQSTTSSSKDTSAVEVSAKETEVPKPASSIFGSTQTTQPAPSQPLFGASKPSGGSASSIFGAPKTAPDTSSTASTTPLFGQPKQPEAEAPKAQSFIFGQNATNNVSQPAATSLFGKSLGTENAVNDKAAAQATNKPLFGGSTTPAPSIFGAKPSSNMFGGDKSKPDSQQPSSTPLFGTQSAAPSNASSGGSKRRATDEEEPPAKRPTFTPSAKPLFGGETSQPASSTSTNLFGGQNNTPATSGTPLFGSSQAPATEKKPITSSIFGSTTPAATPAPTSNTNGQAKPMFSFGPTSTTPAAGSGSATNAAPIFSFGSDAGSTQKAPSFGGSTAPATPAKFDFSFGQSTNANDAAPFQFGGGQTPSAGSSFSFSAGGNGGDQAGSNPFAKSAAAPSTPSTSFTFGQSTQPKPEATPASQPLFGGQPNGTGGGPSFNFTSATPSQTPSAAPPKPGGIFGSLAPPGGEGSTVTNSPMLAPSSMGTTPVNGTPEPQSQNDGDEEAPQAQLSLTDGGPGEEDETIIHEVRARAMKYVPVGKDSDDEGDKKKSPWVTQGVGPLRVLKNKTTGAVRLLLRAEPRGHVAVNKAILPHNEYKATQKTINFSAAKDDGSGLETWVLQVKKPEAAQELAAVMESHKNANKN